MFFFTLALVLPLCIGLAVGQNTSMPGQSVFASNGGSVAFGLNIPNTSSTTDIYFSLRGNLNNTWTAIGLGTKNMKGALVFMMYADAAGTNVTLSPRLSRSTVEPTFSPDISITALASTGIDAAAGTLTFNGRCANCRAWPGGGSLDVTSTAAPFIYAVGPVAGGDGGQPALRSDDPATSVSYHSEFGWFLMDMERATGGAHIPDLQLVGGAEVGQDYTRKTDIVAFIHGVAALVCFLGALPLCAVMFQVGGWLRLYRVLVGFFGFVALAAIALGIYGATYYNKTKNMSTPHQVIGFVVFAFVVIEAALGCVYFPKYRRSRETGTGGSRALHVVVVVLGWVTILLGCINGFLGFPLASHPDDNKILGGVFAAMFVIVVASLILSRAVKIKRARRARNHSGKQRE